MRLLAKESAMRKEITMSVSFGFVLLVFCSSCLVNAQDYEIQMATEILFFEDGSARVNQFVLDESGKWINLRDLATGKSAAPAGFDQLLVTQNVMWHPSTKKILWDFTDLAKDNRKAFKKGMAKFIKKHRGTNKVPKFKATQQEVKVDEGLADGPYQIQLQNDDHNTIIMTDHNRFFRFDAPNTVMKSWILSKATISNNPKTGRYEGSMYTEEADLFFISDFFERAAPAFALPPSYFTDLWMAANFRLALSYTGTCWTNDILSIVRPHVDRDLFYGSNNELWDQSDYRDNLYYNDKWWEDEARLLPTEGTVIDIANADPPENDDLDNDRPGLFAITNLKGYPKKKMQVRIFRVIPDTSPPKTELITSMKGGSIDWEDELGSIGNWYRTYWLSLLHFGQKSRWDDVNEAIQEHGTAQTIRGVDFDQVLEVIIEVKGKLTEKGKTTKISQRNWVYNSQD